MTHHINCLSVLHILISKPNEYVKMLLKNNTINQSTQNVLYHNGKTQMELRACVYV